MATLQRAQLARPDVHEIASAPAVTPITRSTNCFDTLRLFAAISVVIGHSVAHLHVPFFWLTPRGRAWFFDGVPLFFIMSGLLVYRSCEKCLESKKPIRYYYLNRFLRVAPAVYVYAVITTVFLVLIGAISLRSLKSGPYLAWLMSNFALVPVYHPVTFRSFGIGVLNGSLWTIPTEVGFYLIAPAIFLFERKRGFRAMMLGLLTVSVVGLSIDWCCRLIAPHALPVRLYQVSVGPHLIFFTLGIFWSRAWEHAPKRASIAVICILLYGAIRFRAVPLDLGPMWKVAWGVPLSYAVIWFGYSAPQWVNKITRVGDLSYGVYVWHMVVINTFLFLAVPHRIAWMPGTAVHFLVLATSLCAAMASWWWVERPALRRKPFTARGSVDQAVLSVPR